MFRLDGKTVLVSGASRGLGAHFAGLLAGAGAHVIVAARSEDALAGTVEAIARQGGSCAPLRLDVSDAASIDEAAATIADVDVLINNAGVAIESPALDQDETMWDMVIDTNLKGMFLLARASAAAMRKRGQGGAIVNIASILGLRQAGGVLPYAVSKAGAIQLTKVLALELARDRIRVNALAPGYIDTELNSAFWASDAGAAMLKRIPQRRLGRPHDLDGPLLLLASDAGAYMTGSILAVDGGHLLSTL